MDLIMDEDKKKAREAEKREKDREKKRIKEQKKLDKQYKKEHLQELKTSLTVFTRLIGRLKDVDDMNLKCYMLLDKILLASDVGSAILINSEDDQDVKDEIMDNVGHLQLEIKSIMNWLMSEKKITPTETTNPIPESESVMRRR